jgi:hypothetical protein
VGLRKLKAAMAVQPALTSPAEACNYNTTHYIPLTSHLTMKETQEIYIQRLSNRIYIVITVFVNMTVSSWVDDCQCSGGTCCLYLQGRGMKTEVACFSKMPVNIIRS